MNTESFLVSVAFFGGTFKKIETIKMFRKVFGTSLTFAKDFIERNGHGRPVNLVITAEQLGRLYAMSQEAYSCSEEVTVTLFSVEVYFPSVNFADLRENP